MMHMRLVRGIAGLSMMLAGLSACGPSSAQAPAPSNLYLVGEDWVGRWQDGGVAASARMTGSVIDAAVPDDAGGLWLLGYPDDSPTERDADRPLIERYSATALTAERAFERARFETAEVGIAAIWPASTRGRIIVARTGAKSAEAAPLDTASLALATPWRPLALDAVQSRMRAGRWLAPAPLLTGIDSAAVIDPALLIDAESLAPDTTPPAWLHGAQIIALSRDAAMIMPAPGKLQVVALADGKVLSARDVTAGEAAKLRGALSPDGGTAIVFTMPASDGDAWPGLAWDVASGKALPSEDLSIDSGAGREFGQARSLACLLPGGAGAIFSLIGQPADRASEAVLFEGAKARVVPLDTGYVRRCVIGGGTADPT